NAALRFRPPEGSGKPAPGRQPSNGAGRGRSGAEGGGKLWVLGEDGKPKAIEVKTGITDGNQTEIVAGDVAAGQQVIVGQTAAVEKKPVQPPRMF
ncbi:MAG: efflux RND transporter periplasmic adaptor subunit, partial [Sphingomonas sp.]